MGRKRSLVRRDMTAGFRRQGGRYRVQQPKGSGFRNYLGVEIVPPV
jgi:hypothetical protein